MPQKYEVVNSKAQKDPKNPIYMYVYKILQISDPIRVEYPRGIYEPIVEIYYDIELDDGTSTRVHEDNAKYLEKDDLIFYNVSIDDFTLFEPEKYSVKLRRVA